MRARSHRSWLFAVVSRTKPARRLLRRCPPATTRSTLSPFWPESSKSNRRAAAPQLLQRSRMKKERSDEDRFLQSCCDRLPLLCSDSLQIHARGTSRIADLRFLSLPRTCCRRRRVDKTVGSQFTTATSEDFSWKHLPSDL